MALPNPEVWYEFENESLADSSGNGYTGSVLQAHWGSLNWGTMDAVGGAVGPQPDTGSYTPCVGTPYRGYQGSGKIWTCNVWVRTHVIEYSNNSYYIFAFGDYYAAAIIQLIYYRPSQRIYFNTYNISTYFTPSSFDKETEVMLTMRYNGDDGASSTIDLFLNGAYDTTHNVGQKMNIFQSDYYCIAGGENGHNSFKCGNLVGDFRWYESALTDPQIAELYQDFVGPTPSQEIYLSNVSMRGLDT